MSWTSWLPWCRRRRRRRAPAAPRSRFTVERLEERVALSADGFPDVTGPLVTPEASLYTLQLDAAGRNVARWTIDWGDGASDTLAGTATSASHSYAEGPAGHTITATATEHTTLSLVLWNGGTGNGHYYGLTSAAQTWLQAEAEAAGHGGHLVSITSQAEQDFVVNNFLSGLNERRILWTGLNDAAVEGTFVWSSGEAVTFTKWQAGEPNNTQGIEDYVAINWHFGNRVGVGVRGSWNDTPVDGFNLTATAPQPYVGIMEFNSIPDGPVTVRTLQLQVENVAPTAGIAGPGSGVRGQSLSFTLTAADVSAGDQAAGFTFSVDWDGDGTVDQTVAGPSGTVVEHAFAESGSYAVRVTATDRDGGTSAEAALAVDVRTAALQTDPLNPSQTVLVVGGTGSDDVIVFTRAGLQGEVRVWVNGRDEGTFAPTGGVVGYGYEGNDVLFVFAYRGPARLFGGGGNDFLVAGPGDSILCGGDGDDALLGGPGDDVLVGGDGNDVLWGGGGHDVLIGGGGCDCLGASSRNDLVVTGATAFDDDPAALGAVRSEWAARRRRDVRLRNVRDGSGSADRLNGDVFLNGETVLSDEAVDRVFAHKGQGNALFASGEDRIPRGWRR